MSAKKELETKKKIKSIEIYSDFKNQVLLYMGKKAKIEKFDTVTDEDKNPTFITATINLTKLLSGRKSNTEQRIRKLNVKYKITISKAKEDDSYRFEVTHSRVNKIFEKTEKDSKKIKTIEKDILKTIVGHATFVAKDNFKKANKIMAMSIQDIYESEKTGKMIFSNLHDEVYHSSFGISKSQLSHIIRRCYEHYEFYKEKGYDSKALSFGRGFHSKLLTPRDFKNTNVVMPELDLRKSEDKIQVNKIILENAHKNVLTAQDGESIDILVDKLNNHPVASLFLKEGDHEVAFYWKNKIGTVSRGKADTVIPNPSDRMKRELIKNIPGYRNEGIVVDFKTTEDASKNEFERAILKYLYHVQAAAYCEALEEIYGKPFIFIFVVIEKSGPQSIAWYELDEAALEAGRDEYYYGLCTHYKHTENPELWRGYSLKAQSVSIPGYGFSRAAEVKLKTQRLMESIKAIDKAA